jgi:uncharacterized phage-associated protein
MKQTQKSLNSTEKLSELIKACIKYGADTDGKITKTKLAKLVYLSDFAHYYYNLKPITGVEYKKLDHGPVCLDYFEKIIDLVSEDQIKLNKRGKSHLISLTKNAIEPDLAKEEVNLVKTICEKWRNKSTDEIVKFTHEQLPWKISFDNDGIPYSLIIQQDEATLY